MCTYLGSSVWCLYTHHTHVCIVTSVGYVYIYTSHTCVCVVTSVGYVYIHITVYCVCTVTSLGYDVYPLSHTLIASLCWGIQIIF